MIASTWFEPSTSGPTQQEERAVERFLGPSPWAEAEPTGGREAQAFLALAGARTGEIGVHFHQVDQFQCFVGGGGAFAGHPVGPGVVHYADRLRPYGPITPGPSGVSFLTLRGRSDSGASYMPGSRSSLRAMRSERPTTGRNVSFDLAAVDAAEEWQLLVDDPDGLQIGVVEVASGAHIPTWSAAHGDAYAVVVGGQVLDGGRSLGPGAFRFVPSGEPLQGLEGGARSGGRLAVLCLPTPEATGAAHDDEIGSRTGGRGWQ